MDTIIRMFEALGLSALEERVYSALVDNPRSTLLDLSKVLELPSGQVRRALTLLRTKGFVTETATRPRQYVSAPPEAAVEVLALKREEELHRVVLKGEEELHQARLAAAGLADRHRAALEKVRTGDLLEIVTGARAIVQRLRQLQETARDEILVIDRPPYASAPGAPELQPVKEILGRGVKCRVIYSNEALEIPGRLPIIQAEIAEGESARVLPDVATKLVVVDRRIGLIPLDLRKDGIEDAVVVHASFLLHALTTLFDALWEKAIPLAPPAGAASDVESDADELLPLLAAGLKDESVARVLRVSRRTVTRKMSDLMDELGAKTRFQAGLLAGERFGLRGKAQR